MKEDVIITVESNYLALLSIICKYFRAPQFIMSIFFNGISFIIQWCPQKKMQRSNTTRIITSMANIHSFRNWSSIKNPRQTMGRNIFIIKSKLPITHRVFIASPQPACFSFFNLFPKSYSNQHMGVI